jgi:hypothetical protein
MFLRWPESSGTREMTQFADFASEDGLPLALATRIVREAVKDKAYRAYPLGGEAGHYLRWKRGRLTPSSYRDYNPA